LHREFQGSRIENFKEYFLECTLPTLLESFLRCR